MDASKIKKKASELRHPELNRDAVVVIYDGDCIFCQRQVLTLSRLDWFGSLSFVSLHDSFVSENFPQLTFEALMDAIHVVDRHQRVWVGAAAARNLALRLPTLWFLLPLLYLPFSLPLWQKCYGVIARRRYLIAGKSGVSCENGTCKTDLR